MYQDEKLQNVHGLLFIPFFKAWNSCILDNKMLMYRLNSDCDMVGYHDNPKCFEN